jgi:hypothetical protein
MISCVTFAEVVAALQRRLGQQANVAMVEGGRRGEARHGILSPGRLDATEIAVEHDGSLVFKLAPGACYYRLDPSMFAGAEEVSDRHLWKLRIELVGGAGLLVETPGFRRKNKRAERVIRRATGRPG